MMSLILGQEVSPDGLLISELVMYQDRPQSLTHKKENGSYMCLIFMEHKEYNEIITYTYRFISLAGLFVQMKAFQNK